MWVGLARFPHVVKTSQRSQGRERSSKPTSEVMIMALPSVKTSRWAWKCPAAHSALRLAGPGLIRSSPPLEFNSHPKGKCQSTADVAFGIVVDALAGRRFSRLVEVQP